MADFNLREMRPTDGAAIDVLMRSQAQSGSFSMTTRYQHDVYRSLLAQHPNLFGVVVESPGIGGLVGMATAFVDEVRIGGRAYPSAFLENLKVHHDFRRQGIGRRLADWRIEGARRRFGGDGIIHAGIESRNAASLATANRWSTQVLGPVRVLIADTSHRAPDQGGFRIRPVEANDVDAVVDGTAAFYVGHDLVPNVTPTGLWASLAPTSLGETIRHYRVAVRREGAVVAGLAITERFKLMTDHIDRMPRPIELVARITRMFPPDRVIRSIELGLVWHRPGADRAARALWDAVRFEWRDRATNVVTVVDPRGPLPALLSTGRRPTPRVLLMVPVQSPVTIDPNRLIYAGR